MASFRKKIHNIFTKTVIKVVTDTHIIGLNDQNIYINVWKHSLQKSKFFHSIYTGVLYRAYKTHTLSKPAINLYYDLYIVVFVWACTRWIYIVIICLYDALRVCSVYIYILQTFYRLCAISNDINRRFLTYNKEKEHTSLTYH